MTVQNSRSTSQESVLRQCRWDGDLVHTYRGLSTTESSQIDGYRGKRLPNSMHPCYHTRARIVNVSNRYVSSPTYYGDYIEGVIPFTLPGTNEYGALVTHSLDYQISKSDVTQLMRSLTGSLKPEVLLPNMLLELPETLNLWHALKAPLLKAVSLAGRNRHRFRDGSNALLSQNFGLFPLVGDLHKLLNLGHKVSSHVKRLTTAPRVWTPVRHTLPPRGIVSTCNIGWSNFVGPVSKTSTTSQASAWLTCQQRNLYTGPTAALNARVASELLGLHSPAAVLWEATPFSFVADWFYPMGDYLHNLDSSQFADSMQVQNICTCVKANSVIETEASYQYGRPVKSNTIFLKQFRRYCGLPPTAPVLDSFSLPGIQQTVLGGALVLQRYG